MTQRDLALVLIGGILATTSAAAAQPAQRILVFGEGDLLCRGWIREAKRGPEHRRHEQWALGLVSGYNLFAPYAESLPLAGAEAITGWLDQFCRYNPEETIATGARRLIEGGRSRLGWPVTRSIDPPVKYEK